MKVYLAAFKTIDKHWAKPTDDIYILSSFYEHRKGKYGEYVTQKRHILDSGAFSFLKGQTVVWDEYVDDYISFIKKTKQHLFFELDIYKIVGTEKTEQIRDRIQQSTGLPAIPVWHRHLGLEYWNKLTESYSYVGIGGFAIGDIKPQEYMFIPPLLDIAKKNNCRVHGLGFTWRKLLDEIPFDSVDSTTWLASGKFGYVYRFQNSKLTRTRPNADGKTRIKSQSLLGVHNFGEWVKYQKYRDCDFRKNSDS